MVPAASELSHAILPVIAGPAIAVGVEFDELSLVELERAQDPIIQWFPRGYQSDRFESALKLAYYSSAGASGKH